MTDSVKNLYNEGARNEEFLQDMRTHEPEYSTPSIFWDTLKKHLFTTCYLGWLIGNGTYDRSKYQ